MAEIHITGIKYIEINTQEDLEFKYKPDVPKLKLVGNIIVAEEVDEDEDDSVVFLTQKQLNQLLLNKEVELKLVEDRWYPAKPLSKEQVKKVGLVDIDAEYLGAAGDIKCYEAVKITE
ncbi:MAG: hypothetical protein IPJ32_11010 [Sphingobacteriaceae bacterium]|jgi:hypothetical protein|nr:hypothetical protein [Sphingobacteriaceae bacterium]